MDKKFIQDNITIKEELYDILKYADAANNAIKVIYLDPEYVQEFEIDDGESMFEQSLLFAKLYIIMLLSNISAKISRGNDIRAYYVKTDPKGGISTIVNNAINTLKKNNRAFNSMTNLSKVISSFNVFDDLFITQTQDDKKPIDFDIIQGQDITLDNEFLEMLERICIESTGTPLALIDSSSDPEFAKAYTVLNLKYMRLILDYQIDLNPSISRFFKMIIRNEIDQEKYNNIIDALEISLQTPMTLRISNTLEQVNNAKDLAQALSEILLNQDEQGGIKGDKLMLELCKVFSPNINWNQFEDMIKHIEINLSRENNNDNTTEEM